MAQTSFIVDDKTAELLRGLQKAFGVNTNAAVIRRALALANVVARNADSANTVVIKSGDGAHGKEETVLLAG
jgi:hypothetical protein